MWAQRRADRLHDRVLDGDVVAEADLALRGMDVDIHLVRREVDEKDCGGTAVAGATRIGFAERVGN